MTDKSAVIPKLPESFERRIEELKGQYPDSRSVVMPALYMAQEHFGSVTEEAVLWVSDRVGMAPVHVREVATFYTMYYKRPVGKYHFQVCRTLSCALCGSKKISEHLHQKFGILPGQVTKDGKWSYEEVECLGSCGTAPMCEVNDVFVENLTVEKLDQLIEKIEMENPDMRYSAARDQLGDGIKGYPKSEVI